MKLFIAIFNYFCWNLKIKNDFFTLRFVVSNSYKIHLIAKDSLN